MKVILASQSPRRKELMDSLQIPYEVIISHVDETLEQGLSIEEQSKRLAYIKAKAVYEQTKDDGDRIIIGSDTMCLKDGKLYGKPKTQEEAIKNFREFSQKEQEIVNGLAILIEKDGKLEIQKEFEKSKVVFSKMDEEDIRLCLEKENVYDKAGGYHVTGFSGLFISKIGGNLASVLGFPLYPIYKVLKKHHIFEAK